LRRIITGADAVIKSAMNRAPLSSVEWRYRRGY